MKFLVCVKQVPASNEARIDPVTGSLMREGIESILNPFDAYAVEEALRLREVAGGSICALSMGIPAAAEMLRGLLALGVDRAALLTDRAFAGADTLATARALRLGAEKLGGADLLLLGKMATDGDTAQVGPMLAQLMGIPHIADVSRVVSLSEREILVEKLTDDGYLRVACPLPALITVVKEINVPRLPSISGVLRAKDASIDLWSAQEIGADPGTIGLKGSATRVVRSWRPERAVSCALCSDARDLLEKAGMLGETAAEREADRHA